jgi:hypothetical protein
MTREDIIKLANDMDFFASIWIDEDSNEVNDLVKFAKLVAEAEREACAKVCEELGVKDESFYAEFSRSEDCAEAIRARGEA